jgi:two-component system sensor histidine kinase EvgS
MLNRNEIVSGKQERRCLRGEIRILVLALVFCIFALTSFQSFGQGGVRLQGKMGLPQVTVETTPLVRHWLAARQTLRLGVTVNGYEPLELVRGQSVRGITADYLTIIGTSLGLKVEVQIYPDWTTALAALSSGEVDVLGRGSSYEQQLPGLLLSQPYTLNQPVLVGRSGDLGDESLLSSGRLAAVDGYAPLSELAEHFPHPQDVYTTVREALHAVEYRNDRWLVCDAATVAYHLSLGELPSLRMRPLNQWQEVGYSFVFRADDSQLRLLFNRVLDAIPRLAQADILGYWGVSARFESALASVYTPEQLEWLASRPEVKVVVNGGEPPYSFYDDEGNFRGLIADLLAEIADRSGLHFKVVQRSSLNEVVQALRDRAADMTATLLPTPERKMFLTYTDSYMNSSFALIGARDSPIKKLADLQGARIAVLNNSAVINFIHDNYPHIKLVTSDSYLTTLMAVANGDAEAAILLLPVSRYMINQYFAKELRVINSLSQIQASFSFAVDNNNVMLSSVMQASLDQLEPRFIGSLVERWQNSLPAESSVWGGYKQNLRWILELGGIAFLLFLIWQTYLYFNRVKEKSKKAHQEFRSALLDGIPQSVVVRDLEGRFVLCNQTFYGVFGLHPDQVIGRRWSEIAGLDPAYNAVQDQSYQTLLTTNVAVDGQQIELKIGSEIFTFRQWAVPHRGGDGRTVGLLMGWVDVSATQRLLRQLEEVRDQAVQANEAKSRFLAVMSHEIRTPLNAIIGLLELTMERVDQGEEWDRSAIEVAYTSSGALMLLIGDILDLAKIEAGKLTLEPQRNNPKDILDSVQRVFHSLARQKGLYLDAEMQIDSLKDAMIDGGRLKQVLSNVLGNAIKFTDRGGIKLSLQVHEVENELRVVFVIQDTGVGIAPADQALLFEPFSQAITHSNQRGGTGLGLAISLDLIKMMGGSISLESVLGVGTRIQINIQMPALELATSEEVISLPREQASISLRVLLVDDHPPNRLLLRQQLRFLGHQVWEAEDGQQAFDCFQAYTFDVVITDCNMPVMDGYELTQRIRTGERLQGSARCRIIGFTANAQVEEQSRCLNVGMDDCLFKPVSLKMLRIGLAKAVATPALHNQPESGAIMIGTTTASEALFDLKLLDSLTDGDQQLIHVLLGELHASNNVDLLRLDELLVSERWRYLGQIVHRLKGAARMVGANHLIEATKIYEQGLAAEQDDEISRHRAIAVRIAVTRLQEAVLNWLMIND